MLEDFSPHQQKIIKRYYKNEDSLHRQRLAEPDPPPKRLTVREERAALRALLDLPPSEKG